VAVCEKQAGIELIFYYSTFTIENRNFHESIPLQFTAEQSEATFVWTRSPEEGLP